MRQKTRLFVICILAFLLIFRTAYASHSLNVNGEDLANTSSEKIRIGYLESESFVNYASTLHSLLEGLKELGWINDIQEMDYREGQEDTSKMWLWLSENNISPSLTFVSDAYYSLSDIKGKKPDEILDEIKNHDLDLIIVMGTFAGEFITSKTIEIPTMVFAASNAVQSGIIKSETDSGSDYIWAHMDAKRFQRQLDVFYDIFRFEKLGLVFENSPVARSYSAIDDVELIAAEKGFDISYQYVDEPSTQADDERYYRDVAQAYKTLAEEVDAMYITVASLESKRLRELLKPFYENNIPVFSQLGETEVMNGALMSISIADYINIGRFGADNMVRLFQGEKLRSLPQRFESTPKLIINMETAEKIGYKVPFEILLSADKIYMKIGDSNETDN